MAGEENEEQAQVVGEEEKVDKDESENEEEEEDKEEKVHIDRVGNKKPDTWEKETPYQRSARKAKYLVVVNLSEEKDKVIRTQAKSLYIPLLETEETIEWFKSQQEPKEKKAKDKFVK